MGRVFLIISQRILLFLLHRGRGFQHLRQLLVVEAELDGERERERMRIWLFPQRASTSPTADEVFKEEQMN